MEETQREDMAQRIQELEQQLQRLHSITSPPGSSSSTMDRVESTAAETEGGTRVVYIQQSEKVPKFSGNLDRADSPTLEEWIELVENHIQLKPTEKEKVNCVYNHLEGAARIEVKYLPKEERETVNGIFTILREVYGCSHSVISLQRRFFNRKQREGESLLDYSHALMSLMDQIVALDVHAKPKSQRDLRDQFCEGVRDHSLSVRLRDKVRLNPEWTIRDVRREAVQWTVQCEGQSFKPKDNHSLFSNEVQAQATCELVESKSSYSELKALIEAQQRQLDLLMKALQPSKQESGAPPPSKAKRTSDGKPRCFRCDQRGHIARYCTAVLPKATLSERGTPQLEQQEPVSEQSHTHLETNCDSELDPTVMSALVSECPVVEVQMGQIVVPSLLDTGSMVTTITKSFFDEQFGHLTKAQLQDCGWLDLRAGNGLELPYLGYLELDITILGKCVPRRGVLVVKDPEDPHMQYKKMQTPGVLGMNVIKGFYYELFVQYGSTLFDVPEVAEVPEWRRALRHCQVEETIANSPEPFKVRVKGCVTMSTSGLQATNRQNVKELDSMKESISDIINQLQDIDPTRLSFSPFLDLDTQISLAPVSDSPESSVEELHSSSHSVSGSQHSLEPPPATNQPRSSAPCHQQPRDDLPAEPQADQTEEGELDQTLSSPIITAHNLDATTENCVSCPTPASQGDIPNGTDMPRWSPESTNLDCTVDEGRPLIGQPSESVELAVWSSEGQGETCGAAEEEADRAQCCCRCCQCKCCQSGRVPAFFSVLASLLCAAGILYALYFYVPIRPPDCPDAASRIIFTLCCCVVAAVPILLAMLMGAVCQFCTGSFSLQESFSRGQAVQQLFVTASLEQLLLYVLNLVVMAALLPQDQLKLVPIFVAIFILGRLVYWVSLNVCSSWRGFGSGLTVFPLLTMVALNLFLMYTLNLKEPLFGSQDILYNQVTPSSWSGETSQSPSSKPDILPTDIPVAQ